MPQQPFQIEVHVSADKLAADLILRGDGSQLSLTANQLMTELQKHEVTYGIMQDVVERICLSPQSYIDVPVTIAVGKPPENGVDAQVEYTFEQKTDVTKPKELDGGRVDFYNVTQIANIVRGQLLARKHPPTPGIDGVGVDGAPIAAKAGRDLPLKAGKNVVLDQTKTLMYAAIDGQASFTEGGKLNIFPVYEVNGDVDFSVGNIDFVGTVVVRGNVPSGFRIKASGDIRIYGSVEGAELEAGGSVHIKNGIAAQDKGHVIAGHDIVTSYIQNGNVTAGNDITVAQSIMFSQVRAGRNVVCTSTKGSIIGGLTQAGKMVVARVIGNSSSTPTSVEVGAKPEVRNEMQSISNELHSMYETLKKTDQGLGVIDKVMKTAGQLPPDKKLLQIKLTNTRMTLEKQIKELENRYRELEEELRDEIPAVVEAQVVMYPGVKLVFGRLVRFIKQEFSRCRFRVQDGEITFTPLV
ncbi:DUF342 domain-containing protein [Brevibacillus massiliensis]|jgi:hypothetical protein|uniref:DUF342 domain-containing protein n=1 Tax=Brevibacillus massiliensis TaxID=1118054 RepID=UPI0003073D00|nr:FapA family protein [Brevibacillus massiliensis]